MRGNRRGLVSLIVSVWVCFMKFDACAGPPSKPAAAQANGVKL
jgi:hypothetical protein